MNTYKYLTYGYDADGNEADDIEIIMTGLLNDSHALDKAKEDEDAIIDGETGQAFVYRENPNPSRYGCGNDCCSGWIFITDLGDK